MNDLFFMCAIYRKMACMYGGLFHVWAIQLYIPNLQMLLFLIAQIQKSEWNSCITFKQHIGNVFITASHLNKGSLNRTTGSLWRHAHCFSILVVVFFCLFICVCIFCLLCLYILMQTYSKSWGSKPRTWYLNKYFLLQNSVLILGYRPILLHLLLFFFFFFWLTFHCWYTVTQH